MGSPDYQAAGCATRCTTLWRGVLAFSTIIGISLLIPGVGFIVIALLIPLAVTYVLMVFFGHTGTLRGLCPSCGTGVIQEFAWEPFECPGCPVTLVASGGKFVVLEEDL